MNPFLYWFYQFLKLLVRLGEKAFYPKVTVINKEGLKITGPAIVVSNHPNTLLDPFNAASRIKQPLFFLANAGLFKSKIGNWFFSTFYCIPIQRKEDTGGKAVNNANAFEKCDQFLTDKGILFIAPEGGSFVGRKLERIKTGSARIALSAEDKNNFELGLQILPIGLLYEDPGRFRSSFVIHVGQPITLGHLKDAYEKQPFETAKEITAQIEARLEGLIVNPADDAEDRLLYQAEEMIRTEGEASELSIIRKVQQLAQTIRTWSATKKETLYQRTTDYFEQLKALETDDKATSYLDRSLPIWKFLFLGLGFPIYLFGLVNHAILVFAMEFTWKKLALYPTYESTVKFMILLIVLPLSYYLQSSIVEWYFGATWSWIYLASLIPAGVIASKYRKTYLEWQKIRNLKAAKKKNPTQIQALIEDRSKLWQQISPLLSS